jgi:DNA-binding transcriptional MerR regulator
MSVSSEARWTIGELAKMIGVSVRTLRHYEDVGLLIPDRSEGGHRRYGAPDLDRLRQIVALRKLGLGLQHIAAWLDSRDPELLRKLARRRLQEVELRLVLEDRLRQRLKQLLRSLEHSGEPSATKLIEQMEERAMDIELTQIYTGLGDGGETQLANLQRVAKTDPRIEAGGALHELSAQLAFLLAEGELPQRCRGWLNRIESDLFDLGSDLAWPTDGDEQRPRIGADYECAAHCLGPFRRRPESRGRRACATTCPSRRRTSGRGRRRSDPSAAASRRARSARWGRRRA